MSSKDVTVTVQMDDVTDPRQVVYTVRVSDEPVDLAGYDGAEWSIATEGWEFTTDHHGDSSGIYIKKGGNKFNDKKGDKKKHKWEKVTADRRTYRYTIRVTKATSPEVVVTWDPS